MNKIALLLLIVCSLFVSSFNFQAYAESSIFDIRDAVVDLQISPAHLESGEFSHPVGFVSLINKNGDPGVITKDVTIKLKSDDPTIASVPESVTIKAGKNLQVFNIQVNEGQGETSISASLNGNTVFQDIIVGDYNLDLPDDIELVIHFPSTEMHVESEMPFSVFLQTFEGDLVQAPFDISVDLDFEESLIHLDKESLKIEKGNYYAWSLIKSKDEVGNAFIRAFQNELNLQTANKLKISSSFPSGLAVEVFPKIVPNEVIGDVDIIVSLLDSEGTPTLAQEDTKLEFFSNNDYVGRKIDEKMEESANNGIIKKGEFSYHFRQKLNLITINPEIEIGVSAEGLGIGTDCFVSRDAFTFDNPLAGNKTLHIFTPNTIPSNSKSIAVYQIGTIIPIDDSGGANQTSNNLVYEGSVETQGTCDVDSFLSSENLNIEGADGEFFPILSNEYLLSEGDFGKINVISSDRLLLNIEDNGKIESGYSYGTATVSSGKETGTATLATTIKGVGSATTATNIVNTLKHDKTIIFSPTGNQNIRFDKNGNFDLFLISLDGKTRPTFVENEAKYLLSPVNEIIEITKDNTFSHASFHSDSFSSVEEESVSLSAVPVGISADSSLQVSKSYQKQPSASLEMHLPFQELDVSSKSQFEGFVQLVDFRGNPVKSTNGLQVKIESTNSKLVDTPRFINIPEGKSYASFPIELKDAIGKTEISAKANGVISSSEGLSVKTFLTKLSITTGSVPEPIPPGESVEIKIYVDNENTQPIEGAEVRIVGDVNSTVTPTNLKTEKDGSAKFHFTTQGGSTTSFQVFASSEGSVEEEKTFQYSVDIGEVVVEEALVLGLPDWVLYVGLAAMGIIVGVVILFLKKPKQVIDNEEEDIFLEEDI